MNRRSFLALATTAPIATPPNRSDQLLAEFRAIVAKIRRMRLEIRAHDWNKK